MRFAISKSSVLLWARIPTVIVAAAFPVVFAKHIEALEWPFLLGFVTLVAGGAIVEIFYDRGVAAELEGARRRLQFQKARGLAMGSLLGLLSPVMAALEHKNSLTPEHKQVVTDRLNESIVGVLKAVCADVWAYWNPNGGAQPPLSGSVMRVYEVSALDETTLNSLAARTKFVAFGRNLDSYRYILDVVLWSNQNPQFVPIALPVEDATTTGGLKRLLPGAPTAFAFGRDIVISDTRDLRPHAGCDLDEELLKDELEYFESRKIRSLVSLVLWQKRDKQQNQIGTGVLNIHSEGVNLLGPTEEEQHTIIEGLEHYRTALEYLLDGQHQLGV